jgi:hypothetical protein
MSLHAVKNTVIIVFLVPIPCLVLGMTSDRERATISNEEQRYWNRESSPVAIPWK